MIIGGKEISKVNHSIQMQTEGQPTELSSVIDFINTRKHCYTIDCYCFIIMPDLFGVAFGFLNFLECTYVVVQRPKAFLLEVTKLRSRAAETYLSSQKATETTT